MDLLPGIATTSSALNAERTRMDVIAQNIANANTTRDIDGQPYQRKVVTFEAFLDRNDAVQQRVSEDRMPHVKGVRVSNIIEDSRPGPLVYNPGHPHADGKGMVRMPNVEVSREMVDMIASSRAYEANLNVVSTSRQMARQVLSIGK